MKKKAFHILLVDDSDTDIEIIREAFDELRQPDGSPRLSVATDGESALDMLRIWANDDAGLLPNLLLLDINMPKKSGFETLRDLKADPQLRRLPVVILTTSNRMEDIRESYALGAASYISKPLKFADLRNVLKSLMNYWISICEPVPTDEKNGGGAAAGLTLIELLVVTVILAIVSTIAVVKIGGAVNKARKAALITYSVSEFRAGMTDYYLAHNEYPVGVVDPTILLKTEGLVTTTFAEKISNLNVNAISIYYPPVSAGVLPLGGLGSSSSSYSYNWCLLPPSAAGIDLPCIRIREETLEEFAAMPGP